MALSGSYQQPRGTRASLDAKATAATIKPGQIYLISDEDRLAIGLTTNTYATYVKQIENKSVLNFVIDGGGAAITTGIKGDITVPFACIIEQWSLFLDQSGSIVVDIWKDSYANYPPLIADTITAGAKPNVTTAIKAQSSILTGWTTSVSAGDTLRFNVDSITTTQRATLALTLRKI